MKECKKNVILSTGGSGGHIFPALFISFTLSVFSVRIFNTIDRKVFRYIKFRKYFIFRTIILTYNETYIFFFDLILLLLKIFFLPIKYTIFFGNYTNIILFLISLLFNLQIFIHEQNIFFGQVNLCCSFFAKKVFISFPPKKNNIKYSLLGLPVILKNSLSAIKKRISNFKIFSIGGSQGALIFNNILPYTILIISRIFSTQIQITQQIQNKHIGKVINSYLKINNIYSLHTFCKNTSFLYSFNDITLSRSGASTIIELSLLDKFSITVPYFYSKNNHQLHNSKFIKKNSESILVEEKYFSHDWFLILVCKLLLSYRELLLLKKIKLNKFRRLNFFSTFKFIKKLNLIY